LLVNNRPNDSDGGGVINPNIVFRDEVIHRNDLRSRAEGVREGFPTICFLIKGGYIELLHLIHPVGAGDPNLAREKSSDIGVKMDHGAVFREYIVLSSRRIDVTKIHTHIADAYFILIQYVSADCGQEWDSVRSE
jgi:hypothetical protein